MFWPLLFSLGSMAAAVRVRPPPLRPDTPYTDEELLNPPLSLPAGDRDWWAYASDPRRPGPPLPAADSAPIARPLNAYERWALAPYFPADVLEATIHNGQALPFLHGDAPPATLWSITDTKGQIWFPNAVRDLRGRWWLAILAHELAHVQQIRMGLTKHETSEAIKHFGYEQSPIERQARWLQGQVMRDLYERARSFHG
jgi:hypothetical protein